MRVLVVKMSSLGDIIHTLPALTDAAKAIPGIRFDWVVEEAFAEIPAWHPAVDEVIPVALRRWRKRPLQDFRGPQWRRARDALRRPDYYDAVVDAQGLLKSAFITRLVRAPRFGMDRRSAREPLASSVYQHKIEVPRNMHAVERTRLLFARSLGYQLPAGKGDYGIRAQLLQGAVAGGVPVPSDQPPRLLFFHGTARAEKLWPEDRWVELAGLAAVAGYRVWLPWGSDDERERAERIAAGAGNTEVLPRLDLQALAGKLLEVRAAVAVDTGLGHLAAALDVPTVSLYGPTSTDLIGAYGRNQAYVESPIGVDDTSDPLAMMSSITAAEVWEALHGVLPVAAAETGQGSGGN